MAGRTEEARLTTTTTRRKRVNPPRETSLVSSELSHSQPAPSSVSARPEPSDMSQISTPRGIFPQTHTDAHTQTQTHTRRPILVRLPTMLGLLFFPFHNTVTTWVREYVRRSTDTGETGYPEFGAISQQPDSDVRTQ